jgi:hypothetical protein
MSKTVKILAGIAILVAVYYFARKSNNGNQLVISAEGYTSSLKPTQKSIYDSLVANDSGTIKAALLTDGRTAVVYEEPRPKTSPVRMFFFDDNSLVIEREPDKALVGKFDPKTWLFEIGNDKLKGDDLLSGIAQVFDYYKLI